MITLRNDNSLVIIDNGELVSFTVNCIEFIHQKGNKGWRKSDDEMFPIIGPTAKNNFRVHTKKGDAIQDQHGLLRELDYQLISNNEVTAIFKKDYKANTKIKNSKFPEKSSEEFLTWPFDFSFEKHFKIENSELKIDFVILSEKEMPFMLGYHPAFLLSNTGKETFESDHKIYTLQDVYKAGSNAFPILNTDTIVLKNIDKPHLEITTKGFNNFMLWTEVDNMVCIEPITQYPSLKDHIYTNKNMRISSGKEVFSVKIEVL